MLQKLDHPLIQQKLMQLRDKSSDHMTYRARLMEIGALMAYEAFKELPSKAVSVETPLETMETRALAATPVVVPILRAALGLTDGMMLVCPEAHLGHIGLARNSETLKPEEYLVKLPKNQGQPFYLVDPMLATGNSAVHAVEVLERHGVEQKNICFVALLAAPEGIERLHGACPHVKIYTCAVDRQLSDKGYILPGLGDAGDRLFGTDH